MTKLQLVRYQMLQRVRDFGAALLDRFPESSTGGQAFAQIAQALAAIDTHAAEKIAAAQEGQRAKIAARKALRAAMLDVARTARIAKRTKGLGDKGFLMPKSDSYEALIWHAQNFISDGEANLDLMVQMGLPPTTFTELKALREALIATLGARRDGRKEVAQGGTGIKDAMKTALQSVLTLDAVVPNVLKNDAVRLSGWERSRRIIDGSAKPRRVVVAKPSVPATANRPAAEPEVTTEPVLTGEPVATIVPIDPSRKAS